MTRCRLLKIKHRAAPQFEIIQCFTLFLIVTAVREKIEERGGVDVLLVCRYTIFISLEEGIKILIN